MSEHDKDGQQTVMNPLLDPALSSGSGLTTLQKAKDAQEIHEKYRKLKRRFFELEEKHKETSTELQRSGQRNEQILEERNMLLERITELESQPGFVAPTDNTPLSDAFSRGPLDASFAAHFGDGVGDLGADAEIDPSLMSGPANHITFDPSRPASTNDSVDLGIGSSTGADSGTSARLRTRAVGPQGHADGSLEAEDRSASPDVDEENDDSGDYAPPQKGTKRSRDSADYTGDGLFPPEAKTPRRSSRRPAPATNNTTPPSTSRTRVIQTARRVTSGKAPAVADIAQPPAQLTHDSNIHSSVLDPAITSANGQHTQPQHQPQPDASSSNAPPRPNNFNPYSFLMTNPQMPAAAYNPYMMYLPMPGALPYFPPPHFVPAPPPPQRPASDAPRAAKPKRLKAHTVTSKSYSIPMVPRDKKGKPMLPLNVGIMTVINLGDVCMREHFHTERYIFPVGYEVTRRYLSTIDQTAEVVYHCTILDGGDGPKFQIIPSDTPDRPVIAGTATGAWSSIVKQANAIRQRQHSNSVSGPDFFGLGQNTIKHLIQELPNADRLRDYVWQHFVEGGPLGGRHAAVIPALPEEYDAAMPVGPYYPPRPQIQQERPEGPRVSHYPPHIMAQVGKRAASGQQQGPSGPDYGGGGDGRQPGPSNGGGSNNYYLPQNSASPPPPGFATGTPPDGGPTYASAGPGSNGAANSFASIMNAFPTQEGPGHENGGGGDLTA
ncbi:F/Y rich C-terminus-domain-containing protein [Favolaschia claudopus]|uniref:F/Y rich C-terminus-domain-containing protein n=1 Tax=Favolaschia claudopus TaxID=2862362 RepID=A0AAW0DBU9_9AGAR